MPLFEVCVVQMPTRKAMEEGELEKIIVAPKLVVARDSSAAGFEAVIGSEIPATADRSRLEVLVRPFA